eukprot:GDKI01024429.1.p1 GENE.GDKI01024429.1~~GDKI01024429.1.p1  ORF type:complete len:341 (-),score=57.41 GDKI01024429.1:272-1294(-)
MAPKLKRPSKETYQVGLRPVLDNRQQQFTPLCIDSACASPYSAQQYSALLQVKNCTDDMYALTDLFNLDENLMIHAVSHNKIRTVKLLLEVGWDLNEDDAKNLAFVYCCDHPSMCVYLMNIRLEMDSQVYAKNGRCSRSVLHHYVQESKHNIVCALIEWGVEVNGKSTNAAQASFLHASVGDLQMMRILLDKGAHFDVTDRTGSTPLHHTVRRDIWQPCAQLLIDRGANVHLKDATGRTPLHIAAQHGSTRTARMLIDAGADVNAKNNKGDTPLHECTNIGYSRYAEENDGHVAQALVERGGDLTAKNMANETPLQLAKKQTNSSFLDAVKHTHTTCAVM